MRLEMVPSTDFPIAARPGRSPALYALIVLLAVLSIAGLVGGLSLIGDRTGASIAADPTWLEGTPVDDFLLPGIFLALVYGVFGLALIGGLWTRASFGPLVAFDRAAGHIWSWWGAVALGVVLVAWIVYELFVIPEMIWLQPALAGMGLAIVMVAMTPSVRAYARTH